MKNKDSIFKKLNLMKLLAYVALLGIVYFFIFKTYSEISKSPLIINLTIGSNNLHLIISVILMAFIGVLLLKYLDKKTNLGCLISETCEFILMILEVTITALAGLAIFVNVRSADSANLIDIIGRPIYFIIIALFLFFITRAIRKFLTRRNIIKNT